jgi:hypothetical protein
LDEVLVSKSAIHASLLIIERRLSIILLFAVTPHFPEPSDSIHLVTSFLLSA